jgi:hypothetical protein
MGVLGGAALLDAGCSAGPTSGPVVPVTLFPQAYAQALCASLRHCCEANEVTFSDPACTAGWRDKVAKLVEDPDLAANYDPKIATECVERVRGAEGATCDPDPGSISAARDVCQRVFLGKKELGATCTSSLECAPMPGQIVACEGLPVPDPSAGLLPLSFPRSALAGGLRVQAPVPVRRCIAIPPPAAGSSCASPELKSICEGDPASFCDASDGICKGRADVGAPCKAGGCKAGLHCDGAACSPGAELGGACTASDQCSSFLRCDLAAKACAPRLRPGDACASDEECSIGMCDPATRRCLRNAIATSESCSGREPGAPASP